MGFCLRGYVKSKVYQFHTQTPFGSKDAVKTIQMIPIAMFRAAVLSTICRVQSVIEWEGSHEENL